MTKQKSRNTKDTTLYLSALLHCYPPHLCGSLCCCICSFLRQCAICCLHSVVSSRCIRAELRSRPWMRAHPPEPGKAHGQVVNKWKWKIATTCWARSSRCRGERWAGHDGCPVSPLLLIWSKKIPAPPPTPPFTTIIDKQMCAGRSQAHKIACVQNCLWDEKFCLFVVRVQSCFCVQEDCFFFSK